MERTLAEIGQTDSLMLLSDYKTDVIHRHERILNSCQQLYDMYEDVRRTKQVPAQYAEILNITSNERLESVECCNYMCKLVREELQDQKRCHGLIYNEIYNFPPLKLVEKPHVTYTAQQRAVCLCNNYCYTN